MLRFCGLKRTKSIPHWDASPEQINSKKAWSTAMAAGQRWGILPNLSTQLHCVDLWPMPSAHSANENVFIFEIFNPVIFMLQDRLIGATHTLPLKTLTSQLIRGTYTPGPPRKVTRKEANGVPTANWRHRL